MIVSFSLAVAAPLIGLVGTVFGMTEAFGELEKSGGADPNEMAGSISSAMNTTMLGLVIAPVGLVCGLIFLGLFLKQRKREAETSFE